MPGLTDLLPEGWSMVTRSGVWAIYDDEGTTIARGDKTDKLIENLQELRDLQTEWAIAMVCEGYKKQNAES